MPFNEFSKSRIEQGDVMKDALVAWVQSAWNWKFVLIQSCQAEITTAYLYAAMVTPQDRNRDLTKPD